MLGRIPVLRPGSGPAVLGAAGALLVVFLIATQAVDVYGRDRQGGDFLGTVWEPSRAVERGHTPYPDVSSHVDASVYPPALFLAATPVAILPKQVAIIVWQGLLVAAAVGTLLLLRVSDVRCHAIWLSSCPVVLAVLYGNATLLVGVSLAAMWRWRDRAGAGLLLAAAIGMKLFAAPLVLWLVATGRFRAFVASVVGSIVLVLGPWAAIGFDGLDKYPGRLDDLARELGGNGVLLHALARQLGAGYTVATITALVAGAGCISLGILLRRDEIASLAWFMFGGLLLTPIAWIYYPALLVIPLAARYPQFHASWLLVVGLWVQLGRHPPRMGNRPAERDCDRSLCLPLLHNRVAVSYNERLTESPALARPSHR